MDSKEVNRVLKRVVWDELKARGFTERTGRTAWRRNERSIDVVNFQSFNSYLAGLLEATTFSFSVRLGVAYPLSHDYPWIAHPTPERPKEQACAARRTPRKGLVQQVMARRRRFFAVDPDADEWEWRDMERPDIWFVSPDGSNTEQLAADALEQIVTQGLPWFDELGDLRRAIEIFATRPDRHLIPGAYGEGYGALGVWKRSETIAALAMELGDVDRARKALRENVRVDRDGVVRLTAASPEAVGWLAWLDQDQAVNGPPTT